MIFERILPSLKQVITIQKNDVGQIFLVISTASRIQKFLAIYAA